jgi:NADH-quinone oxidoreductase subunit L
VLTFLGRSRMEPEVERHVHESPPAMSGVLIVLAVLSAVGGFISIPHFLEPLLPIPPLVSTMSVWHVPLVGLAIALSVAGLALAFFLYRGDARRAEALRIRFAGVHRLLSGKYYIDELYDALIGRPLHWVSDHVFLRFSDRAVIDGTLHGLAGIARGSGGVLARVQTGNLHLYVYLVLIGSFAALLWMWAHG